MQVICWMFSSQLVSSMILDSDILLHLKKGKPIYQLQLTSRQMKKHSYQNDHDDESFDIKKCKIHRKANSYGMPLSYSIKCECCGRFTQKQQLTWNFSLIKIYYCGPQLVSYLITVKYLTILLFFLCLTYALPLMIINYKGKCCDKKLDCSSTFMLYYSIFNQFDQHKKIAIQDYITFANFLICLLFWHFLRNELKKVSTQIDETNFFPNQFAILCELPSENIEKDTLLQNISKWWRLQMKHNKNEIQSKFSKLYQQSEARKNQNLKMRKTRQISNLQKLQPSEFIEQIIFSYNYSQFQSISSQLKSQKPQTYGKDQTLKIQMQFKNAQMPLNQLQSLKCVSKNRYFLAIFKEKSFAEYFSSKNNPNTLQKLICFNKFRYLYVNKKQINVTSQHYPCEILWKNHHIQRQQKLKLFFITISIIFLLIIIGSGFNYLLCFLYQKFIQNTINILNQGYYILVGLLINIMILIGNKMISIYNHRQRHDTYVSQKASHVYKIVFFNVFLILVSPFIIFKCMGNDYLWKKNGFIETEVISLVIYMLAIQIERYLNPSTLKMLRNYSKFNNQQKNLNQKQANKNFNKPYHYIERQYAAVATIVFINFFLSTYIPFVTVFSCIWMLLQFWLQKANISYFYNEDEFHSQILSKKMVQLIEFSFSFLIFGSLSAYFIQILCFTEKIQPQLIFLYTLFCVYCFLSIFLPHEQINTKIFKFLKNQDSTTNDQICSPHNYQNVKKHFLMCYEDFNDAYLLHTGFKQKNVSKMNLNPSDQLESISASLSLTLKQRLLSNNDPIIGHFDQKKQENDEYFEYQKKINMKKAQPKVNIPPLFQKDKKFRASHSIKQSEIDRQ